MAIIVCARKITRHHRHQREALPPSPRQPAEHEDDRERKHDDQQQVKHVRELGGVLERVRSARAVEAAAVGAEQLDDLHRGHRAAGNLLGTAGQRRREAEAGEALHRALTDQY
jgi:hypothetical protein